MSRRGNRRKRRDEKRELKRKETLNRYDQFENMASLNSLYLSAKKASKGVSWKASVQRYLLSILFKIQKTRDNLLSLKDVRQGFICFNINERGKTRKISSVHFSERVVQKAICMFVLYPMLTSDIIFDNCASQKDKGTLFATNRLTEHLRWFYRKHKRNGYILTIDFKGYFESIYHEPLKEVFRKKFSDEKIIKYADDFVDAFGERGLGLGSETSQINAIHHINKIDHYVKEVARIKCYGRYMDDSYIIHHDKEYLKELLNRLETKLNGLGVQLNKKKTCIHDLRHGFIYLKTKFFITESGRIIRKPCRDSITKERRKLKKQAVLFKGKILSISDIKQSYQSWKGSMKYRNARKTVYNMDKLYKKLFERGNENGKCIR